jgi:hypothetical protein
MAIGVFLGYLYLWSGNLKISMFMHFLNNFIPVLAAYLAQKHGKAFNLAEINNYPAYIYPLSAIAGTALMFVYYRQTRRPSSMVKQQLTLNDSNEKWVHIYTTPKAYEAEIIAGSLKSEGIPTVVMNKRDSSYSLFGHVEIYVHPEDEERARQIIPSYDI